MTATIKPTVARPSLLTCRPSVVVLVLVTVTRHPVKRDLVADPAVVPVSHQDRQTRFLLETEHRDRVTQEEMVGMARSTAAAAEEERLNLAGPQIPQFHTTDSHQTVLVDG